MAKAFLSLLFITVIFFSSCNRSNKDHQIIPGNVLAMVGGKIITVNDFIKRCEYVPRPNYCRGDNYIHKKIALNSLIAEKLFAMEFENRDLLFTKNQMMVIRGQKEQTMRQLMLKQFGFEKVKIDTVQIRKLSNLINREYKISFISLDKKYKNVFSNLPNNTRLKDIVLKTDNNIEIEQKLITKNDNMIEQVMEILFYGNQNLNFLYGPYEVHNNALFCFEINGWTTRPKITENEKKDSWNQAIKNYSESEAKKYYGKYVSQLLKDKSIEYKPDVFSLFSNKLSKIYLVEKNKKKAVIENRMWEKNNEIEIATFDDIKKMENSIILTHDNRTYKISELLTMIKKHPLVFRNKTINPDKFSNELKYAIADLFRDFHITNEAYRLGLDQNVLVTHNKNKWEDYIKSINLNKPLGRKFMTNRIPSDKQIILTDSLQIKYSRVIKIDMDKFEKIKLSKTDMSVMYSNQPYAKVEPNFPIITNDHIIDYGKNVHFFD